MLHKHYRIMMLKGQRLNYHFDLRSNRLYQRRSRAQPVHCELSPNTLLFSCFFAFF